MCISLWLGLYLYLFLGDLLIGSIQGSIQPLYPLSGKDFGY